MFQTTNQITYQHVSYFQTHPCLHPWCFFDSYADPFWLAISSHPKKQKNMFLVGGFNPLKNTSQLGWLFPIYGKIKMFQSTNQVCVVSIGITLQSSRPHLKTVASVVSEWFPPGTWSFAPWQVMRRSCHGVHLHPYPLDYIGLDHDSSREMGM